jgi:Uma2 family endonuclease
MSTQPEEPTVERMTLEEYLRLPESPAGTLVELVRGVVVREPAPGGRHGQIWTAMVTALNGYVQDHGLGVVLINTLFVLDRAQETARVPDIAFLRAGRAGMTPLPEHALSGAPDLAVEILSPSNRWAAMQEKVSDYLAVGAAAVWVIDPRHRHVIVHESDTPSAVYSSGDVLTAPALLPGFALPIDAVFSS